MTTHVDRATSPTGPPLRTRQPRRQKVALTIAQQIVEEIARNLYEPGTKLPPEREMLEQYAVGRGTLRESLRFLEMNGVITVRPGPGGGPVVAEPDAHDLASTLGLFLEAKGTTFGAVLQLREILEPSIAELAAVAGDADAIAAIGDTVDDMRAGLRDPERFLAANEDFHRQVALAAQNPILALLLGSIDHIADGTRVGINFPIKRRNAVLSAHQEIYDAIASGEPENARILMSKHVHAFRRYIERNYPGAADVRLRWSDVAP